MRDLRLTVSCTVSLLSLAIMIRNQYLNVDTPTAKACGILASLKTAALCCLTLSFASVTSRVPHGTYTCFRMQKLQPAVR